MRKNPEHASETGVCAPAPGPAHAEQPPAVTELVYVGDPMCSWCWGIAPAMHRLQAHCEQRRLPFRIVVGGLRPGGGDPWNAQFRQFLSHHWREIGALTGQPFSEALLDRESFNYDTEPSCRAVVAARLSLERSELGFFGAVQRKFYVDGQDPQQPEFYRGICTEFGIDFGEFLRRFDSAETRAATLEEFQLNRSWGVTGYPTILLRTGGRTTTIATGFATFEKMRDTVDRLLPPAR